MTGLSDRCVARIAGVVGRRLVDPNTHVTPDMGDRIATLALEGVDPAEILRTCHDEFGGDADCLTIGNVRSRKSRALARAEAAR